MLQIRENHWETNSSSVHVFCISSAGSKEVPSEVKLSELKQCYFDWPDGDTALNKIQICYNIAVEKGLEEMYLAFLCKNGVNVIFDVDDGSLNGLGVFKSDSEMATFLFNSASISEDTDNNYTEDIVDRLVREGWDYENIRQYRY